MNCLSVSRISAELGAKDGKTGDPCASSPDCAWSLAIISNTREWEMSCANEKQRARGLCFLTPRPSGWDYRTIEQLITTVSPKDSALSTSIEREFCQITELNISLMRPSSSLQTLKVTRMMQILTSHSLLQWTLSKRNRGDSEEITLFK